MRIFVPGRLCLFGEHTDWMAVYHRFNVRIPTGRALVALTNQGIHATADRFDQVRIESGDVLLFETVDPKNLKVHTRAGFMKYAAATALYMINNHVTAGINIQVTKCDLPIGAGLSSSAAICVLVAEAYNRVYGLNLSKREIAKAAMMGERAAGSMCGLMDQAVVYRRGLIDMIFTTRDAHPYRLKVGATMYYLIVDLGGQKDTIEILGQLHEAFPWPRNDKDRKAHRFLTELSEAYTDGAGEAIKNGDLERLGSIMVAYQYFFDRALRPIAPALDSPLLDQLLGDANLQEQTLGMKGVGSHGDGSAQILCSDYQNAQSIEEYIHRTYGMKSLLLRIDRSES